MSLDEELIGDIILCRYNQVDGILFDIEIKNIRVATFGDEEVSEKFFVDFDSILIDHTDYTRKGRYSESMQIDFSEYTCLLRQKKLKEIGI